MDNNKIETFTLDETRFLSNFYPYKKDGRYLHDVTIEVEGLLFDCVECAYQAAKTDDIFLKARISKMNPYEVVEMSKAGQIPVKADWDSRKLDVMYALVKQKFSKHNDLKRMLLGTGEMLLEEGNTWGDTYWGISDGIGENNLGKILMKVRTELRQNKN